MKIEFLSNTNTKDISISNEVFSKEFNESLIHQALVSFMAVSRQGSSKQKNRSEVRGGRNHIGKKELEEPEQEQSEVHCGEVGELPLLQDQKISTKRLTKKCIELPLNQYFQSLLDKIDWSQLRSLF